MGPFLVSKETTAELHKESDVSITILHSVVLAAQSENLLPVARKKFFSRFPIPSLPFPFPVASFLFPFALPFARFPVPLVILVVILAPEWSMAVLEQKVILRYNVCIDLEHALPNVLRQQVRFQYSETDPGLSAQKSHPVNIVECLDFCKGTCFLQIDHTDFWLRCEQLAGQRSIDHSVPLHDRTWDLESNGGYTK
jgi:hypothetical protein